MVIGMKENTSATYEKISRRKFLKFALAGAAGVTGAGATAGAFSFDTYDLKVSHSAVPIKGLPKEFDGFRIAHLTDLHNGPGIKLDYLSRAIDVASSLAPDLFVLTGDYVTAQEVYIRPVMKLIEKLSAPYGKLAVLGNHDHWANAELTRNCLKEAGATEITNTNIILSRAGAQICVAGVGDLWEDSQRLYAAFRGVPEEMPRLLLSHNPDYAEEMPGGYRVDLMISGHTHGGQVVLPLLGAPFAPSRYGQKYCSGMKQGKYCRVYISRGIGCIRAIRFNCPPELPVLTLIPAQKAASIEHKKNEESD
jgi:hypothetical protein